MTEIDIAEPRDAGTSDRGPRPPSATCETFRRLVRTLALASSTERTFVLAAIHDLLAGLDSESYPDVTASDPGVADLCPFRANYLCGMVEYTAWRNGVRQPDWTRRVPPLADPWFATEMPGLRLHLLANSPVPFRLRNIFIDSTVGSRV